MTKAITTILWATAYDLAVFAVKVAIAVQVIVYLTGGL